MVGVDLELAEAKPDPFVDTVFNSEGLGGAIAFFEVLALEDWGVELPPLLPSKQVETRCKTCTRKNASGNTYGRQECSHQS